MPKAEPGSTKWVGNQMRSRGLQRLRWYCQTCEKQCRDANGFKCHTQSVNHVRNMQTVAENPLAHIERYTREFLSDFIGLLRTSHGEKYINANRFYQEYIANKDHVHMNATKFASLNNLVSYLGCEGICHVKDDEKDGLCIACKDTRLEKIRRETMQQEERSAIAEMKHEERKLQMMGERGELDRSKRLSLMKDMGHVRNQDTGPDQDTTESGTKFGFSLKRKVVGNVDSNLVSQKNNVLKRARLDGEATKKELRAKDSGVAEGLLQY